MGGLEKSIEKAGIERPNVERPGVDIRRLRYFVAVCDHGGFSRAAQAIGVAQPALTRQVQLLEQDIGVELVTRNGRAAVPTEAGADLATEARPLLQGLDLLVQRIRLGYAEGPVPIRMGICPTISPLFLPALQDRARLLPLSLQVIEAYSGDLYNLMQCNQLDFALTYHPSEPGLLHVADLLTEKLVLVTGPDAEPSPLALADVAAQRLILPSSVHQLRRIIDEVAALRGITLTPVLELDSLSAVKSMLDGASGGFSTILPYHSVAADAEAGRFTLRPIVDPAMTRTITLLRPKAQSRPLPEALISLIHDRATEIRAGLQAVQ